MSKAKISGDMTKEDKATLRKLNRNYDEAYGEYTTSRYLYSYAVEQLHVLESNIDAVKLLIEANSLRSKKDKDRYLAIWQDIANLSAKIDANKKTK